MDRPTEVADTQVQVPKVDRYLVCTYLPYPSCESTEHFPSFSSVSRERGHTPASRLPLSQPDFLALPHPPVRIASVSSTLLKLVISTTATHDEVGVLLLQTPPVTVVAPRIRHSAASASSPCQAGHFPSYTNSHRRSTDRDFFHQHKQHRSTGPSSSWSFGCCRRASRSQ